MILPNTKKNMQLTEKNHATTVEKKVKQIYVLY